MKVVGLVSGGKDSCFNLMKCVENDHEIVCLANLYPPHSADADEIDSYMYQSVGHSGLEIYGEAFGLPIYRKEINGKPITTSAEYEPTFGDEVEDLFQLLSVVKERHPDIEGVSVGAILSNYQKERVGNVCARLSLKPLCYLWGTDQLHLLDEIINAGIKAVLVKVACLGLNRKHLGLELSEVRELLTDLNSKFGVHVCGEGGEYESFVLDCPLFKKRIILDDTVVVDHTVDDISPVSYLLLKKLHLEDKDTSLS